MSVAKAKALISCAVTAQLICVFVFAYAKKKRFSHNEAQFMFCVCIYIERIFSFRINLFVPFHCNYIQFV